MTPPLQLGTGEYATQQYQRRENIEISGIPSHVQDRDLENFVIHRVLRKIGLNQLDSYEIVACHRLGRSSPERPANVIVRFVNRKRAHQAIANRYNLRNYPDLANMFIVENLCPKYKSIFNRCKQLKTEGKIKHVWSYNGTVHYKTEDNRNIKGSKVFHIAELNRTFRDIPENQPTDNNNNNNNTNEVNNTQENQENNANDINQNNNIDSNAG